ncbi:VOC family protein [Pontibacter roseus]|uniref:VOC family protein n=1 Tax=Pontibacter roseus TaxID=336989 RepID=UPI00037CC380|nr:VOC family protein [Pontibacter roseus]
MKILSLEILSTQLQKQQRFYTEVLGLPLLSEDDQQFAVQAGHSTITFRKASAGLDGPYHFAFSIPGDKIEEARAWLHQRVAFLYAPGATSPIVHHELWDAQALYFYDAEFNILEFIAHRSAAPADTPFGPEQLRGIAEVGMTATDVPLFAQQLKGGLHLTRWKSASPLFEAVGDETGMFVVSKEQRPWFPTQNPALPLPARVQIEAAGAIPLHLGPYHILPTGSTAAS